MPRKPKQEKETITVVVNGTPVAVILHPPSKTRKAWYAYWNGQVASKSTGQRNLKDAMIAAENMVKSVGRRATLQDAVLTDEEFVEIQRVHYRRRQDPAAKVRAEKSLQSCLEAIAAFKEISGLQSITVATPDDCAAFQRKALSLPKNTLRPYPNSKEEIPCYSPNTVVKWSVALQAAWERVCKTGGKKCVRGVVEDTKLLTENPWKQFTWIEGYERPIRQFDAEELVSLVDYLDQKWSGVTVASLYAKVLFWSWGRREEIASLTWPQLRQVGREFHFQTVGKWGIKKWFRIPDGLLSELNDIRTSDGIHVFGAYSEQLRRFYKQSVRPGTAKAVSKEFNPICLGDWFHERLADWSKSLSKGHAYTHVFRKTSLQYARSGEDARHKVAKDARVSEDVMMTHYVEETDPELRDASNRTFCRILASLPSSVAQRYGHFEIEVDVAGLEAKVQAATAEKNWPLVAELSALLARNHGRTTG